MRPLCTQIFAWPGASSDLVPTLQAELEKDLPSLADTLAEEHARLFTGPSPVVPLWESVWVERDKLLFGAKTLQVEELFADWNLANGNPDREPLDHLGFELGFLAWLMDLAENDSRERSHSGHAPEDSSKALFNIHINAFAPQVLKKVSEETTSNFYKIIAQNGLKMLETLNSVFKISPHSRPGATDAE